MLRRVDELRKGELMNTISFISANFVARELGYHMTEGWMQGDGATQDFFKPPETFHERFGAMLAEVKGMGFQSIDLWGAHLHPNWATTEHLNAAKDALQTHGLRVSSLAAWVGTLEGLEGFCRVANAVGAPMLAGGAPLLSTHRAEFVAVLKHHNVKMAIENHPEKSVSEVLGVIGDGADGFIGAAPDTGWWGTQGVNAAQALRELRDHTLIVHLKDVLEVGEHNTCRFGDGIVDIRACAQAIKEIGYDGVIGIEHEPEDHDPTEDILESKRLLEGWLS
jgi:L-ribulose-5-phosphate 3-epimerase